LWTNQTSIGGRHQPAMARGGAAASGAVRMPLSPHVAEALTSRYPGEYRWAFQSQSEVT